MATAQDVSFAEAVVEERLVSKAAADECLADLERAQGIGAAITLDAIMVKKGLITKLQADAIIESIGKRKIPRHLAGFEIIKAIRRTPDFTVFKAKQVSMDRFAALKILSPQLSGNKRYVERLFREARAAATISHDNILQTYEVGEASGLCYVAAEYVDGEVLSDRLARDGKLKEGEALAVTEQICSALHAVHTFGGTIHGNVRPENIQLAKSGLARLAELGLSRANADAPTLAAEMPHYISPEMARGTGDAGLESVDIRSDIYSLGAVLFHMVTGTPPYGGTDRAAIIRKHLEAHLPSPGTLNPDLTPEARGLIENMMAKDKNDRYRDPEDLLQEIQSVRMGLPLRGTSRQQRPAPKTFRQQIMQKAEPAQSKSNVALLVTAVASIILALIGLIVFSGGGKNTPPPPKNYTPAENRTANAPNAQGSGKKDPAPGGKVTGNDQAPVANLSPAAPADATAQKVAEYEALYGAQAKAALAELRTKAKTLELAESYREAVAVLQSYPDNFRFGQWRAAIDSEIAALKKKARPRVIQVLQETEALAAKKQYDQALRILERAEKMAMDDLATVINRRIAIYKDEGDKKVKADAQKAERELPALARTVATLEERGTYDLALQECDSFAKKYETALARYGAKQTAEINALKAEVESIRETWNQVSTALANAEGEALEVRAAGVLLKGKLTNVTANSFTVEVDGKPVKKKISEIDPEQALTLAGAGGDDVQTAARRIPFLLAAGAVEKAEKAIGGLDPLQQTEWKERIARRKGQVYVDPHAGKVDLTLERVQTFVDKKDAVLAYRAICKYRDDFADTPSFKEVEQRYNDLRIKTEALILKSLKLKGVTPGDFITTLDLLRDREKWREENKCPKTIPCPHCSKAVASCTVCNGKGTVACPTCRGRRSVLLDGVSRRCMTCRGEGKVKCTKCGGATKAAGCEKCGMNGYITCLECTAKGYRGSMPDEYLNAADELRDRYKLEQEAVKGFVIDPDAKKPPAKPEKQPEESSE